jgi:hypothetical protein
MNGNDNARKRDFAHTVMVITARALAEHEMRTSGAAEQTNFAPHYQITLLAASPGETIALPKSEVTAEGGNLGITFEEREDGLKVTLQLRGYAALQAHGGREARLVSSNGAIDYAFRFSRQGTGICLLADAPEVREGLARCSVLVAGA